MGIASVNRDNINIDSTVFLMCFISFIPPIDLLADSCVLAIRRTFGLKVPLLYAILKRKIIDFPEA
jgi:hypothetical protein